MSDKPSPSLIPPCLRLHPDPLTSMLQRLATWQECTPDVYTDPENYYQPKPEPREEE